MSRSTAPRVSPTAAPSTQKPMGHTTPSAPSREKIAVRAYEKWCQRGRPCDGSDRQDWLAAEAELRSSR